MRVKVTQSRLQTVITIIMFVTFKHKLHKNSLTGIKLRQSYENRENDYKRPKSRSARVIHHGYVRQTVEA